MVPETTRPDWLDALPCGLVVTRPSGEITEANGEFLELLGLPPREVHGRRLQDFLTASSRAVYQTHGEPLLHMEGRASELKLQLSVGGQPLPVLVNIRVAGGSHVHAVFVAHHRDRYERELRAARDLAEELAQQRSRAQRDQQDRAVLAEQLIGIVSHDLRHPLLLIRMAADALARSGPKPRDADLLGHISTATGRAQQLVKDLLDFTNARLRGGISADLGPLDLHALVDLQVRSLRFAFPGVRIAHEMQGSGACEADPDRLIQLLTNLVANAVSHGDTSFPVTVVSDIQAENFRLAVHNRGPVVPPELQGSAFEPMVRGAGARSEGVGLGLYIVSEIARAHGGHASLRSTAEEGTTFEAWFPR